MAWSQYLFTIFGVSPIYFPTSCALLTSIMFFEGSMSMLCSSSPMSLASEVFPVPGFPVSTKFMFICCTLPIPLSDLCFRNMLCTASLLIKFFTVLIPTKASRSLSTSSSGRFFVLCPTATSSATILYISSFSSCFEPISSTSLLLCLSTASSKSFLASRALPKLLSFLRHTCSNILCMVAFVSSSTINCRALAILRKMSVSSSAL